VQGLAHLLRNETRVRWRELTGETKASTLVLTGVLILGGVHLFLWAIVRSLRGLLSAPLPPETVLLAALVVLVLFPFGVTAGINHSVVALFDRGDLDLLAASPLGSRTVFASRVLAVAASVFVALGLFMLPIASTGLLLGLPQLLGAIPTLVSLSLVCASVGRLITLLLVRLLGARRARTTAQLVAALSVFLLFVASQLPSMLGGGERLAGLLAPVAALFAPGRPLAATSIVWLPFRSMFLHPLGTLTSLATAGLIFWAAVLLLHRAFAHGIGQAHSRRAARPTQIAVTRFQTASSVRAVLKKEWKLIRRDPYLISQVLLQVVYFIPAAYLLLFTDTSAVGGLAPEPALATMLVVLSGIAASSLSRITMIGEEAGDLLAASPMPAHVVHRAKSLAVLVPIWAVLAPAAAWLHYKSPAAGATLLVFATTTSFMVTRLRLWNPVTAGRKDLFKRRSFGDPVVTMFEFLVPLLMAVAAYLLVTGSLWTLTPLALTGTCVAVAYARRR